MAKPNDKTRWKLSYSWLIVYAQSFANAIIFIFLDKSLFQLI